MKKTQALVIILGLLTLISLLPTPAHAAASLRTDQPLYTTRDKQATLLGSGLSQGVTYYIWTMSPADNRTRFTGTSFSPVSGGMVPPGIALPLSANASLGTYSVSLSNSAIVDASQATAHYGVWGPLRPLYQRTQSVQIVGGGLFPGTSLRLTIRDPAGNYIHQATLASTANGDFNHTWRVAADAITDVYTVFVDGTGTYDNAQQDYVSESKCTVTQAVLTPKILQQPKQVYQRTEQAAFSLALQYPDGSPVLKSKPGVQTVLLLQEQVTVAYASVSLVDSVNGIWMASARILANGTSAGKYRFELPAMSFDDGSGNKGGLTDTFSDSFQVRNASLVIRSEVNGTQIQIPFGQVSIISKVTYPDGTLLTNGTVRLVVSTGSTVSELDSVYDPTIQAWRASYPSSFSDLWRVGTWTFRVNAADTFGNSGTATYDVAAQPYLFIAIVAVLVAAALFGRWTLTRYGRRVYFRVRKIIQRFRPGRVR
ncbi:MAG: hypothetical protein WB661_10840 [Candidatus Bathyarchaeia archaeon]